MYDKIEWEGRELRVPKNYTDYLTEKYGDWSVTVKIGVARENLQFLGLKQR
jgi:phosphorylcholine metabolism protein LicD